ncbi:MAG TPA: 1,2-phenylacetyl-CoA epoxidase subunit PaaD, partial [Streptomyces sp.]
MVTSPTPLEEQLLAIAGAVPDPELPVLTLSELGVVRAVHVQDTGTVEVDLTPTYTGCPAIETMTTDIEHALQAQGFHEVTVHRVLTPAWSTDDITEEGRRKLREFGIAPPRAKGAGGPVPVTLGTGPASVTP